MTPDAFFTKVCEGLGFPGTPWRLACFKEWARLEGMPYEETFNPLATTRMGDLNLAWDRGSGPGNWNTAPVRVYRTPEAGVTATVETIANGLYPAIIRCFREQRPFADAEPEFDTWIGPDLKYSLVILEFMTACAESKDAAAGPAGDGADAGAAPPAGDLAARLDAVERLLGGRERVAALVAEGQDFWRRFEEMQTVAMAHLANHGGGVRSASPRTRPDVGDFASEPRPGRRRSASAAPASAERPVSERPAPRVPRGTPAVPAPPAPAPAEVSPAPRARRRRSP